MRQASEDQGPAEWVTPGEFLKRKMAYYGLNAGALASEIDVHVQTIYNVTTGKRPISAKLAAKLARRFVEQVDVWLSETIELTPVEISSATKPVRNLRAAEETSNVIEMPLFAKPAEHSEGILIDREILALLERPDSGVSIMPFNPAQVEPASYDLTMGIVVVEGFDKLSEYDWLAIRSYVHEPESLTVRDRERIAQLLTRKAKEIAFYPNGAERSVSIERLRSVVLIARETVQFDKFHLADVGGTARNAIGGLLVSYGFQIDPGYRGAMIFTAINIGLSSIRLTVGQKLASLAIRRLHRPPDKAYDADNERQIRSIGARLDTALKAMFTYKKLAGGEHKASSPCFEETFLGTSLEDVQNKVVSALLRDLAKGYDNAGISSELLQEVRHAIESVTVDRSDAQALIRHFKVTTKLPVERTLASFRMKEDRQTLHDTLNRLGLDPLECMVDIVDEGD